MSIETVEIFPWNANFQVGIPLIDDQHRVLVALLNELVSHLAHQSEAPALNSVFDRLKDYTLFHFESEEQIWQQHFTGDPWFDWHQKAHQDFVQGVLRLKQEEATKPLDDVIGDVVKFLTHWLAYHILESDMRLARAVRMLPSGMSLAQAKELANQEMSGATRVIIDTAMNMYDQLAERTVAMTREINKRKQLEVQLRAARLHAEAASSAKSDALSTVSHEIRNPLHAIIGFSRLGLDEPSGDQLREYMDRIQTSSTYLLGIVNDLLDTAKIEAGKLELEALPFSLSRVLREVKELASVLAHAAQLTLVVNVSPTVPDRVVGDGRRLRQVLINLLSNAIKFTPRGKVELTAVVDSRADGALGLRFSVADQGPGLTPEQLERLFTPFTQGARSVSRTHGGTGLGLVISRQLAGLMGGHISVQSTVGQGSTFTVTVALKEEPVGVSPTPVPAPVAADPRGQLRGLRVLLVEDDRVNQLLARSILTRVGVGVTTAGHGREALELLSRSDDFDAVLLDLQMPVMDGFETAAAIRSRPALAGLPIIAMTADAMSDSRQRCLRQGMNEVLTKPIDLPDLYAALARHAVKAATGRQVPRA